MKHIPRIFITTNLFHVMVLENIHHLKNVLKIKIGNSIKIFNAHEEKLYKITQIGKTITCEKIENISPFIQSVLPPNLAICNCSEISTIINYATQIGCKKIQILQSDFTQNKSINLEKLQKVMISALEQSYRISPVDILPPIPLKEFVDLNQSNIISLLPHDTISNVITNLSSKWLLVGPEGGFSLKEINLLSNTTKISLPTYILKSETAVSFGMGYVMGISM